jgi:hypothetical protein
MNHENKLRVMLGLLVAAFGCGDDSSAPSDPSGSGSTSSGDGGHSGNPHGGGDPGGGGPQGGGGEGGGGLECAAGFADCDEDAGNGCETATTGNREHCGACGNACTGWCDAATCKDVEVLAPDQHFGAALALGPTEIYWASSASTNQSDDAYQVQTLPKTGGTPVKLVDGQDDIVSLTVGDGLLFIGAQGKLLRTGLDGSALTTMGAAYYPTIAVCNGAVYWNMSYSTNGYVYWKGEAAPAAEAPKTLVSIPYAYATNGGSDAVACSATTIVHAGKDDAGPFLKVIQADGTGQKSLTTSPPGGLVTRIVIHGADVYYLEYDLSTGAMSIRKVPLAGGPQADWLYGSDDSIWGLSVDDQYVYFFEQGVGLVRASNVDGSGRVVLLPGAYGYATANDATHVYYLSGELGRIPK